MVANKLEQFDSVCKAHGMTIKENGHAVLRSKQGALLDISYATNRTVFYKSTFTLPLFGKQGVRFVGCGYGSEAEIISTIVKVFKNNTK